MNPYGSELSLLPTFSPIERAYLKLFGTLSILSFRRYLTFKYFALRYMKSHRIYPTKALDVGCGYGGIGFDLARTYPKSQVLLYDTDQDSIDKCGTILRSGRFPNVSLLESEAFEQSDGFSLVVLIHVLEHVENDRALLAQLSRKIQMGGYFYIDVPVYNGEVLSDFDKHVGHVRTGYKDGELREMLGDAGLEVVASAPNEVDQGIAGALSTRFLGSFKGMTDGYPSFKNIHELGLSAKLRMALLWPVVSASLALSVRRRGNASGTLVLLARKIR